MDLLQGQPVQGELHSTNASAGVEVTLYEIGSDDARTLDSDETIVIDRLELVSAATGDLHLFTGADATPGAGETVARGTVAANGGIVMEHVGHRGQPGHKAWFIAPNGVSDCVFYGSIHRERHSTRPEFKEALVGG